MKICATATELAEALAHEVVVQLRKAIAARNKASLMVSGGRSPIAFFNLLARQDLDWEKVWVSLVDERWVATDSPDSNEKLLREHLLIDKAQHAQFIGLRSAADHPQMALDERHKALSALPQPYDVVVLGMGEDGHTASLFPGAVGLADAMDVNAKPALVALTPPVAPHPRISLNLAAVLNARQLFLPIQGAAKRAVFDQALNGADPMMLPITAVLSQSQVPVTVFWAP